LTLNFPVGDLSLSLWCFVR